MSVCCVTCLVAPTIRMRMMCAACLRFLGGSIHAGTCGGVMLVKVREQS